MTDEEEVEEVVEVVEVVKVKESSGNPSRARQP